MVKRVILQSKGGETHAERNKIWHIVRKGETPYFERRPEKVRETAELNVKIGLNDGTPENEKR